MATKSTRKFKKGDQVVCFVDSQDSRVGMTGTVKRYARGYPDVTVVIERDDGGGWSDGSGIGWNILEAALELRENYVGYDMD